MRLDGLLGEDQSGRDLVIAPAQGDQLEDLAFALGAGFLFVSLYGGNLNGINALLFGSIIGVTEGDVTRVVIAAAVAVVVIGVIGRPLLFASIDPDVAGARGVPTRWVSIAFTVLLGLAAAASAEVTGALLVFALLVLPAGTAQSLTARPAVGLFLSVGLAVVITWTGLAVAYYSPYPIGFWLTTFAFAVFLATRGATARARICAGHPAGADPGAIQRQDPDAPTCGDLPESAAVLDYLPPAVSVSAVPATYFRSLPVRCLIAEPSAAADPARHVASWECAASWGGPGC